jgi:hypothetical protein
MEFVEMPGMRLTRLQARRLWNLNQTACDQVLDALVEQGFLKQAADGAFLRQWSGRSEVWNADAPVETAVGSDLLALLPMSRRQ